jgi:hypothetical protein
MAELAQCGAGEKNTAKTLRFFVPHDGARRVGATFVVIGELIEIVLYVSGSPQRIE